MFRLTITASGISEGRSVRGLDIGTPQGELEHFGHRLSIVNKSEKQYEEMEIYTHPKEFESATI